MAITAETRTDIIEIVVGMFDAAPGASVLAELTASVDAGTSLRDLTVALANSTVFQAAYPNFLTNEEFATNFLTSILGGNVTQEIMDEAVAIAVTELNGGMSRADLVWLVIDFMDTIAEDDENLGTAAAEFNNKVEVAEYYSVDLNLSASTLEELENVIGNVDATDASVTSAKAVADGTSTEGQTFNLTTGVDTILGTKNDDTINATDSTLTGLDSIDGGEGVDTLNIQDVTGNTADISVLSSLTNIEKITLVSTKGVAGGSVDFSSFSGLTNATVSAVNAGGAAQTVTAAGTTDVVVSNAKSGGAKTTVTGGNDVTVTAATGAGNDVDIINTTATAGLESATVTGGHAIVITDNNAKADTLTSASVTSADGSIAVNSDALTTLSLAKTAINATVTAKAGTRELAVGLNEVTGGTVQDNTATTVNVNATTKASSGVTLTANAATSVNLDATGAKLTLADVNLNKAKTLTYSGDSAITVSATTDVGAVTTITGSGTGGLTVTPALATGVTVTGSDGADAFTIAAHTKAVSLGAGDDKITMSAALGSGGSVTGGDGTDTVVVNAASFSLAGVTGFETLGLGGAATGAYDANGFTALTHGALTGAVTYNKVAGGSDLTITATTGFGATYNLLDATGTGDSLDLTITGAAAITANTLTADAIETINIAVDDTNTTLADINHVLTLAATDDYTTINVSGDAGLTLTHTGTSLTTFDASGTTNADSAVSLTTGALTAAATLTGGAGGDTLIASAATKSVTLNGNGGDDTLTAASAKDNTVNGGDGDDTITTGTGADTIDGGAGDDTITSSTGLDMITGGEGADTINVAVPTNGNSYAEITDFTLGTDDIVFTGTNGAETFTATAITLAGTAVFQDYLDAATSGDGSTNSAVSWFQFAGDTYVVADNSAGVTFANGADHVVKLTGAVSLATATIADFT